MMRTHPRHRTGGLLTALLCCTAPFSSVVADPEATTSTAEQTVTLIKTPPEVLTRQNLPNFVGISAETVGARGLSMNLVVIPPGAAAEPHFHKGFESAVYVLEGRVETRYGPGLEESVITETGDFLFIPPRRAAPANQSERDRGRPSHRGTQRPERAGTCHSLRARQR